MNIKSFIEDMYLSVELVKKSPTKIISFLDSGIIVKWAEGAARVQFNVEMDGKHKSYTPNGKSMRNLSLLWGEETNTWAGKFARVYIESNKGKEYVVATAENPPEKSVA